MNLKNKITKGIIFGGCSFTWGSGLWYYSNLSTIIRQTGQEFDSRKMNISHLKYMDSVRFPRIVSNHFNSFEFVNPNNGGSNEGIIDWWKQCFTNGERGYRAHAPIKPHIEAKEVSYFVFQLTQWHRNFFLLDYKGQQINKALYQWMHTPIEPFFIEWLNEKNLSLEEFINNQIEKNLNSVKEFLQYLEMLGIKTILLTWPDEYVELIEKDEWLNDRFIEFNYKNNNYKCLDLLMQENKELMIKYDFENISNPPDDEHPSINCHKLIAEHIINKIHSYENKI